MSVLSFSIKIIMYVSVKIISQPFIDVTLLNLIKPVKAIRQIFKSH